MTKEDLLKKWNELTEVYVDKEARLEMFIQKWIDGEYSLDDNKAQQAIDDAIARIEQLKKEANETMEEYTRLAKEEILKEEGLVSAKRSVKYQLGVSPDEMVITGGTLSSNANESHLIGREKTPEELELDRQYALAEIRAKVASKEISLAQASELKRNVELVYGNNIQENKSK